MLPPLKKLLAGIIDYAGLFPPAKLSMPEAMRCFASHRAGPESWMLSRMIVPVIALDDFDAHCGGVLPTQHREEPWLLSAIAAPATDPAKLDRDLERIERFNDHHAQPSRGSVRIDSVELRAENGEEIDDALDVIPDSCRVFVEIPAQRDPRGLIAALSGTGAAAKVRTGGPSPESFPSPRDLARFIWSCAMAEVPFKATAGLHHPLRRASATVAGAVEFGFLNVFIGAALAHHQRIDEHELARVLSEESIEHFAMKDDRLGWNGRSIAIDDIETARESFALSYGSCSFEEPLEDLKSLGLL